MIFFQQIVILFCTTSSKTNSDGYIGSMIDHISPVLKQKIDLEDIYVLLHFESLPSLKKKINEEGNINI